VSIALCDLCGEIALAFEKIILKDNLTTEGTEYTEEKTRQNIG
jgi:hypothetical protein